MVKLAMTGRGLCVAIAVALIVLSQALLTAPQFSASATPLLDAFGNPICITSTGTAADADTAPSGGHDSNSGCDMLACGSALQLLQLGASDAGTIATPFQTSDLNFGWHRHLELWSPDYRPGKPRAPPARA